MCPKSPQVGRTLRRFAIEFCLVIAVLIIFSIVIRIFDLDLRVSGWFFRADLIPEWLANDRQPSEVLYKFGPWPAILVGIAALLGLILSIFRSTLRRYRRSCLYLILVLAIGPGFLVNMVLKDHWGRPRPRDVIEFGGPSQFLPVGQPGIPGKGVGFPSGHAAMGFYFTSLYILWRGRRPRAARAGMAGGLAAGTLIGFQRLAVGGHFLSDVVWSGGIVYLTALVVDAALPREWEEQDARRKIAPISLGFLGVATIGIALFRTPYYQEFEQGFGPLQAGTEIRVSWGPSGTEEHAASSTIQEDGSVLILRGSIRGYGFFDSEVTTVFESFQSGDTLDVRVHILPQGFFTMLQPRITCRTAPIQSVGDPTPALLHRPRR